MDSLKSISIVLILITVIVIFIINEKLRKELQKALNEKVLCFKVKHFCIILIVLLLIIFSLKTIDKIKYNIKVLNYSYEQDEQMIIAEEKNVEEVKKLYNEIFKISTDIEKCKNPYIPESFEYVEGRWNTGFVIQDENKNQFVWIPCTNITNNEKIPILKKRDFSSTSFIKSSLCYDDAEYLKEFLTSALKNGGFYISRFEIGKDENNNPVSKSGCEVWTNITKKEAEKIASSMENKINSKLINGYAYDTAFYFIYDDIGGKINKSKKISGTKSIKNIYDIVDDMYEITTEVTYENIVVRGIARDIEYVYDLLDNRLTISYDTSGINYGFRTIIYK